jgi:predicted SnoaL-like aldol condensation-catalyzing enzyme
MAQSAYVPKAQEGRNKAVIERYFREVLDGRAIERLPELMTADVILHRPGFDVVGVDSAMQRLRTVLKDYSAFSSGVAGLIAEGDMVSVRIHHRTRVRPHVFRSRAGDVNVAAEQDLEWTAIVQFRMKDGKIAEEWVMRDELGMLAQLGKLSVG